MTQLLRTPGREGDGEASLLHGSDGYVSSWVVSNSLSLLVVLALRTRCLLPCLGRRRGWGRVRRRSPLLVGLVGSIAVMAVVGVGVVWQVLVARHFFPNRLEMICGNAVGAPCERTPSRASLC